MLPYDTLGDAYGVAVAGDYAYVADGCARLVILQKATKNLRKHKVSFTEAATVFDDPLSITVADPDHSAEEDRLAEIQHRKKEGVVKP